MGLIEKFIIIGISLVLVFVIFDAMIMPSFQRVYEHGFGSSESTDLVNEYCVSQGSVTACSGCNATTGTGYGTFLDSCHSLIARANNTHCNACSDFGFRSTSRGLNLMILVVWCLAFVVLFIKKG